MVARWAASISAACLFVVLAFGSGGPNRGSRSMRTPSAGTSAPQASDAAQRPPPPGYGNWDVQTVRDPMTDAVSTLATLEWSVAGWLTQPRITVRCVKNKTEVIFDFQESPTRTGFDAGFNYKVTLRWDDEGPTNRTFAEAEGLTTAMFSFKPLEDAKRLMKHRRLRVQYTAALGGTVTNLDADLTGGDVAVAEVAKACGW